MRRISTATKSVDKFGAGKHGFTNGNAVGGIAATDLEDVWFDHVQEELAGVIEAAGIALDAADRAQLLLALRSAGVFQTATQFDNTTRGATTAFVRNELLGLGNATYATIFGSLLNILGGYQQLPSGFIIQGGHISTGTGASTYVVDQTFPIAFPTACMSLAVCAGIDTTNLDANGTYRTSQELVQMGTPVQTGFKASLNILNNTSNARALRWIAIGY